MVVCSLRENTSCWKNLEILNVFVGFYINNDKPWKSLRSLRVKPKTLEIFEDFAFFIFSCFFFHFPFFHVSFCYFFSGVALSWVRQNGQRRCGVDGSGSSFTLERQIGDLATRAEWSAAEQVQMTNVSRKAQGRIMNVAGASDYERAFFVPLHRFMTLHRRRSVSSVPRHVAFTLRYVADQLESSRHCACAMKMRSSM